METKTRVEQFPKPDGDIPPEPGPETPLSDRIAIAKVRSDWIMAFRKYLVATAVDGLDARLEALGSTNRMTETEIIAFVLGSAYLEGDGTIARPGGVFAGMFGL